MRTALSALLVVGCGGGSTPPPATPANSETGSATAAAPKDPARKPTNDECVAAVDRAIKVAHTDPEFHERLGEQGAEDEMRAEGVSECNKEWTGVTLDCVMTGATVADIEACMKNLDKGIEGQP